VSLPWPDALTLAGLLIVLPLLAVVQARMLEGAQVVERMAAYLSSGLSLAFLGWVAWAVGSRSAGPAALGLVRLGRVGFVAWTAALVVGGLALTAAFRVAGTALGAREAPLLRELLPRSGRERAAFAGLSLAAGAGEELAYRGYVIPVLAGLMGPVAAAAVSSAVFGVLHVYQGPLGVARTAALGGLLAWGFLESGSLWPPIAAHAILDVMLGIALAERLMVPDRPSGVPGTGNAHDT